MGHSREDSAKSSDEGIHDHCGRPLCSSDLCQPPSPTSPGFTDIHSLAKGSETKPQCISEEPEVSGKPHSCGCGMCTGECQHGPGRDTRAVLGSGGSTARLSCPEHSSLFHTSMQRGTAPLFDLFYSADLVEKHTSEPMTLWWQPPGESLPHPFCVAAGYRVPGQDSEEDPLVLCW